MNGGADDVQQQVADLARRVGTDLPHVRPPTPGPPAGGMLGVVDDQADRVEVAGILARPLSIRWYEQQVDQLVARLASVAPGRDVLGPVYAESALRLAEAALDQARQLALPYVADSDGALTYTPEPTEVRDLIARLGRCVAGIEQVARAVQHQLGQAYHGAARGELVGPPSSNAAAEVEAVMRDLLAVERATAEATERATSATRRLERIRRPATE